jgi:hypothetical protein
MSPIIVDAVVGLSPPSEVIQQVAKICVSDNRNRALVLSRYPELPDYLPGWQKHLLKALTSSDLEELKVTDAWYIVNDISSRPLKKEEAVRQRVRPSIHDEVLALGTRFSLGFSLLLDVIPNESRSLVRNWLRLLTANGHTWFRDSHIREVCKIISSWAKRNGDGLVGWKELVSWDTLGGYVPAPPMHLFVNDVVEWVSDPAGWEPGIHLPGWWDSFKLGVLHFIRDVQPFKSKSSFIDFITDGSWARSGASGGMQVPTVLDYDDNVIPIRATKNLIGLRHTPDEIYRIVSTRSPQKARAMVKREAGKARAVVVSDFPLYMKMAWISDSLEPALRRVKNNSLFLGGYKLAQLWEQMGEQVCDFGLWKVPIDQSHFDHNVSFLMIREVILAIDSLLLDPEQRIMLDNIMYALTINPGSVQVGDLAIPIQKGILSGWRWTALFDTWINYAEMFACSQIIENYRIFYPVPLDNLIVQGDDVRYSHPNPGVCVALCEVLRVAGFEVNPGKTWLSTRRDEYLRNVAEGNRVSGYLTRAILAILWRNPIKADPPGGHELLSDVIGRWTTLLNRGSDISTIRRLCFRELKRVARGRIALPDLMSWISTPIRLGGAESVWVVSSDDLAPYKKPDGGYRSIKTRVEYRVPQMKEIDGLGQSVTALRRLGFSDFGGRVAKTVAAMVDTHQPHQLVNKVEVVCKVEQEVPMIVPDFSHDHVLAPLSAKIKSGPWQSWVSQIAVIQAASHSRDHQVDALLDPESLPWSRHIRRTHGKGVWIDWLSGALAMSVRRWPGWSDAYLSSIWQRKARLIMRKMLASMTSFRRNSYKQIERGFWCFQPDPATMSAVIVGI